METTQQTGTTLAILAPYAAYKLRIETPIGVHVLTEMSFPENELYALRTIGEQRYGSWFDPSNVLPVLFAFEDLCTPLADGTIPAVEVAKIQWPTYYTTRAEVHKPGEIHLWAAEGPSEKRFVYLYESDLVYTLCFSWKAADYLRSQHFAVGLQPHQYIRKTA